jgi:tungstate transport system substrate-binding protein
MELRRHFVRIAVLLLAFALAPSAPAQRFITVASTTSTEQSGLFKHILPIFEQKTGIEVRVVALGTGQALDLARRGDADVVFMRSPRKKSLCARVTACSAFRSCTTTSS